MFFSFMTQHYRQQITRNAFHGAFTCVRKRRVLLSNSQLDFVRFTTPNRNLTVRKKPLLRRKTTYRNAVYRLSHSNRPSFTQQQTDIGAPLTSAQTDERRSFKAKKASVFCTFQSQSA